MQIEDLIKQRRKQLDVEQAPPQTWTEIQRQWKTAKEPFQWWKLAAVIFMLLSVGLLTYNYSLQQQIDDLASLGDISEEYRDLEADYLTQINQLQDVLPLEDLGYQHEFAWIYEELESLEEVNKLYRADIGTIDDDELVSVLIDYYEKKLRLLKKFELEIKRTQKTKNNETDNSSTYSI